MKAALSVTVENHEIVKVCHLIVAPFLRKLVEIAL